jgi:hypothetical protein
METHELIDTVTMAIKLKAMNNFFMVRLMLRMNNGGCSGLGRV